MAAFSNIDHANSKSIDTCFGARNEPIQINEIGVLPAGAHDIGRPSQKILSSILLRNTLHSVGPRFPESGRTLAMLRKGFHLLGLTRLQEKCIEAMHV